MKGVQGGPFSSLEALWNKIIDLDMPGELWKEKIKHFATIGGAFWCPALFDFQISGQVWVISRKFPFKNHQKVSMEIFVGKIFSQTQSPNSNPLHNSRHMKKSNKIFITNWIKRNIQNTCHLELYLKQKKPFFCSSTNFLLLAGW